MKVRVQWSAWRFVQRLLLIVGLLAAGFAGYSYAARYAYQAYENWRFDRDIARRAPTPPNSPIGRIAIPRLGISAIVKEGAEDGTLDLAAGHISSTALPGQPGNVGIAAHRDNLFRNLRHVKRDDEITLTTLEHEYVYRVVSFRVVNPTDVSVLAASADEKTLTLVTCYPFYFVGHAPKRFIVRARQIPY